jgi:uncharacterized protein (DUF2252 family)
MTVFERIERFNKDRRKELLAYKYQAMAENHFRFFRGTCHLFYEDLVKSTSVPHSPAAWICGDLHLENFGSFKSDNRQVYFDLNDFDEAILAPAIANRQKQRAILSKRTRLENKKLRINLKHKRHLKLDKTVRKQLKTHMQAWLHVDENSPYNYTVTDAVLRLVGTGSLGLERYELLLLSSNKVGEKYMLLDVKQATASSLTPYIEIPQPSFPNPAARIAELQGRMQNRPPALLSSTIFNGLPYIVQEMQPEKDSINFRLLKNRYRDMYQVVDNMGMLTASAQLRSAGRQGSAVADDLIAFGNDESWIEKALVYARQYAEQVRSDYEEYLISYRSIPTLLPAT